MSVVDGKVVLVTGGTGSIGTEVVKALYRRSPKEVRVLSRTEDKHYRLGGELPQVFHYFGDVARAEDVLRAARGVDIIIHAAAMKHVPMCEKSPIVACQTNIEGALNVLAAALKHGVERVVGVSTDKACSRDSLMGMTKYLMERMFVQDGRNCVRLGNVVPSAGSVFPLWKKQIAEGGPVTITDPDMTRFLFPIRDVAEFIMATLEYADPGEIWIPRLKAARLDHLANAMIGTSQVGVVVIGARPGEATHEYMFTSYEARRVRAVNDHFVLMPEPVSAVYGLPYGSHKNQMTDEELAVIVEGL